MGKSNWKQYFDFSPTDTNRMNGKCRICHRNYKDKYGVFSNFLKHLKRLHSTEYNRVFDDDSECSTDDQQTSNDGQNLKDRNYKESRIILSITKNLIIRCNLPINFVEKVAFRDFMKECNFKYRPVSSKRVKYEIIPSLVDSVQSKIREYLSNTDHITLTVDTWSDRRCRSFLGITCHFLDQKMIPQVYLIDFVRFKYPHNSESIHQLTEEVLERFDIKKKIFKIITDNASSMIKAYKFGLSPDCANSEDNELFIDIDPHVDDFEQTYAPDSLDMMNTNYEDTLNGSSIRLSCFAHTLQLCVRDGLKNIPHIARVLGKCQTLVKFSTQSSVVADLLDGLNKHMNKMNMTRWNSEYMLIKSILSIGKTDIESIVKQMDTPFAFLQNDFMILEEIINILEPFNEISIKCQSETIATISLVVPGIVHFINHLSDIKANLSFCSKLVEQLQSSIEKRFSGIIHRLNLINVEINEPFSDALYFVAAVLDPSFKFFWMNDLKLSPNVERRLKQNIVQLILDDISNDSRLSSNLRTEPPTSLSTVPKPKKKIFAYTDYDENFNNKIATDPTSQLDYYLNDPIRTKFSDYWSNSRLTILKQLVTRIFSVQASSAPVERVFSHAGLILSSRRMNMNERLFKDLVFLKVNQTLL